MKRAYTVISVCPHSRCGFRYAVAISAPGIWTNKCQQCGKDYEIIDMTRYEKTAARRIKTLERQITAAKRELIAILHRAEQQEGRRHTAETSPLVRPVRTTPTARKPRNKIRPNRQIELFAEGK